MRSAQFLLNTRVRNTGFALTVVAIALTGCTSATTAPEATPTSATIDANSEAVSPEDWVPHEVITHPTYTDEELEDYRDAYLEKRAQVLTAPPPEVELIRWTTTLADDSSAQAACLTDAGFPAEPRYDSGVSFDPGVPEAQEEALNLAMYVCAAQYTPVPALTTDWTPEQIGMAWDYWNEAFIPCLQSEGVSVPDIDPPSRQAYIDSFFTGSREWYPPTWIASRDDREYEIAEECPPMPPHKYFYGS